MKTLFLIVTLTGLTFNAAAQESSTPVDQGSYNSQENSSDIIFNQDPIAGASVSNSEITPYHWQNSSQNYYGHQETTTQYGGQVKSQLTQPCLNLLKERYGYALDGESLAKQNARDQVRSSEYVTLGIGAGLGVATGFATGNPLIGVGMGSAIALVGTIGNAIEKGKIKKTARVLSASEKIVNDQPLDKKEAKAFEKVRKKVSKRTYGDKNALSDVEFAHLVQQQKNSEDLFCDIDYKGRANFKAYDKNMVKRLSLAQKCNDVSAGSNSRSFATSKTTTNAKAVTAN